MSISMRWNQTDLLRLGRSRGRGSGGWSRTSPAEGDVEDGLRFGWAGGGDTDQAVAALLQQQRRPVEHLFELGLGDALGRGGGGAEVQKQAVGVAGVHLQSTRKLLLGIRH